MERPCYVCNGTMRPSTIDYLRRTVAGVMIVENVPATVCDTCGESTIAGDVLDVIGCILAERPTPERTVEAAVYSFAREKAAATPR